MNKKQHLHVVANAMSIRPGGGLTVLLGVIQGLKIDPDVEYRITVVCSATSTREAIEEQGIAEVKQPLVNAGGIKRQFWVTRKMGKYVGSLKPDIFLSTNQFIQNVACPQVVYHINLLRFLPIAKNISLKERIFEHLRNYSAKQALKKCAANVYESSYIRECAEKIHRNNNPNDQVIYIGLPDNLAEAMATDIQVDRSQICSITNGNPHKDNTTLIKSIAELVRLRPDVDWKLKIAGGLFSQLWEKYKLLAEELGVLDRIEWLGFVQQDELTKLLSESLCLISTSQIESFCMVALESMARGCPSIVADCASMPESVGDAGVLVAPGDHTGFAEAVIGFYDDDQKRAEFSRLGLEHIKQFRWDACGREFSKLFVKLANDE